VPADLIIVDIFMPEKEGLDTILEIREVAPHVKTIAISGGGMTGSLEYLDYADTFGVDRTFTKPLDLEEVVKEVARLLVSSSGKQESD
jgi:YesN/AraC family two-component response regulator